MNLRSSIREWVNHMRGNPDGTVFIGAPELRALAHQLWTTPSSVSRAVNRIVREHRLDRVRAIDGTLGYEIRKEWF
jgi:hypothetical protein